MTSCDPCPTGNYASSAAQASCATCPPGNYLDALEGAKNCTACGAVSEERANQPTNPEPRLLGTVPLCVNPANGPESN